MKKFYIIPVFFLLFSSCCNKGAQEGITLSYKTHRQFFKELGFKGIIYKSEYCKQCELNKYKLVIDLSLIEPTITIKNQVFQPYYYFNKNRIILSVPRKIYEGVAKGMEITKNKNSDFIIKNIVF